MEFTFRRCLCPIFVLSVLGVFSQNKPPSPPPVNWQLLDGKTEGYPGIGVEKVYRLLLVNKKPLKRIVVAVIDDGFDSTQPDLAGVQWVNNGEIPGNGLDDDHNGYVDDIHGWNFVGNNRMETFEEVREYVRLKAKFGQMPDSAVRKRDPQYPYWKAIAEAKNAAVAAHAGENAGIRSVIAAFETVQIYWQRRLSADSVPFSRIKQPPTDGRADSAVTAATNFILSFKNEVVGIDDRRTIRSVIDDLQVILAESDKALAAQDTVLSRNAPAFFRMKYLHDDPYVSGGATYGNNNTFPDDTHGTECAGVIGALRDNDLGGKGVANSVSIMPLRINAMGHDCDEWDKDVANAIRYATDNGAQVISMSFGKFYSPQKEWVDDAIAYAAAKGVLLVHAAGNNSLNTDSMPFYPREYYPSHTPADNLITVGASTYDSSLVGDFSNYGSQTVDVFAPGVNIYMPVLNGKYASGFGTSFACPVVAGLAAFLWSYYPDLSYRQIRRCIEQSVTPDKSFVVKPGTTERVPFLSLSRTGGIVNAFAAFQAAEEWENRPLPPW